MKKNILLVTLFLMAASSIIAQTINKSKTATFSNGDVLTEAKIAIKKANMQWVDAWENGKPKMLVELFGRDGKLILSDETKVKNYEQLFEYYQNAMKRFGTEIKNKGIAILSINTWLDGDVAYEAGIYSYKYQENGKPMTKVENYITIWKKQADGKWRLFTDTRVL